MSCVFFCPSQSAARTLRPSLVSVYVLVTSVKPLTSFVHQTCVVMTQQQRGRVTQVGTCWRTCGSGSASFHSCPVLSSGTSCVSSWDGSTPIRPWSRWGR